MSAIVPILPAIELKRILYATDLSEGSRAASRLVAAVARHYEAQVYAAHVWSPPPYPLVPTEAITALDRRQELEIRKRLQFFLQEDLWSGVQRQPVIACGSPAEELEKIVRRQHIDLAVACTHARTGLKHFVLGSVTEDMVRQLSCPVLSVGPRALQTIGAREGISNILFPTDFSRESLSVLPYLASIGEEFRSQVTVLHVLSPESKNADRNLAETLCMKMREALENEISPRCPAMFVVQIGDAAEEILACAKRIQADLIGLGVRCATDIAAQFHETTAYRILCEAECPVLSHHSAAHI